jgi:hypothetical protein
MHHKTCTCLKITLIKLNLGCLHPVACVRSRWGVFPSMLRRWKTPHLDWSGFLSIEYHRWKLRNICIAEMLMNDYLYIFRRFSLFISICITCNHIFYDLRRYVWVLRTLVFKVLNSIIIIITLWYFYSHKVIFFWL